MEADPLERLSISEGTYDCDSDPDGCLRTQLMMTFLMGPVIYPSCSLGRRHPRCCGWKSWEWLRCWRKGAECGITTGIVRHGKNYCSIEETLYLVEIGALDVVNVDGTPLLLSELYEKVTEGKNRHGFSLESFEVYQHLKFLGYTVGRHSVPWSVKKLETKTADQRSAAEDDSAREELSEGSNFITEMFGNLHFDEMRPVFDVYLPNSKFKKSAPGDPSFLLCLVSGHTSSEQEINVLETHYSGHPLKFCTVEVGLSVSFHSPKLSCPSFHDRFACVETW